MAVSSNKVSFGSSLFSVGDLRPVPDLNALSRNFSGTPSYRAYQVVSTAEGKELTSGPIQEGKGTTSLKEISKFVREALKEDPNFAKALEQTSLRNKTAFYCNLQQISTYIERHNKAVDANFCIQLLNVILLILTLGMFSYKESCLIENFAISLADLVQNESLSKEHDLSSLPLDRIVRMSKEEQKLLFRSSDLAEKEQLLGKVASLPHEVLVLFDLNDLEQVAQFVDKTDEELQKWGQKELKDSKMCVLLLTRLAPNPKVESLEGKPEEWHEFPFDQLRRMPPEQFVSYCDSLSDFPPFFPFFPWSLRKYALENSTTLVDSASDLFENSKFQGFFDGKTLSVKGLKALCSDIAELTEAAQFKIPIPALLPSSFFAAINWETIAWPKAKLYLEKGPEDLLTPMSFRTITALLDRFLQEESVREIASIRGRFTPDIMGKIGLSWFFGTVERKEMLSHLVNYDKARFAALAPSSAQLLQIVNDRKLADDLCSTFSSSHWDQVPTETIISCADAGTMASFYSLRECSDEKLLEILQKAGPEYSRIWYSVPAKRACDLASLEPYLPKEVQEHNQLIRQGREFVKENKALSDGDLIKSIAQQKQKLDSEKYRYFWEGLEARTHQKNIYDDSVIHVKSNFEQLQPR